MKTYRSLASFIRYLVICLIVLFSFSNLSIQSALAEGLKVSPINPRYFSDSSGNAVYLTGSHTWNNSQDVNTTIFDYPDYLDFLTAHNHNFIRLWYWEEAKLLLDGLNAVITPNVYTRTGPGTANDGLLKFDLTTFNQAFFDRLRSRVILAQDHGIYVSIMLFNGWSIVIKNSSNPWPVHPFNGANNINGINGDPNNNGIGEETHTLQIPAITSLQEAYIRKVIDTVNDLDNVLYEVSNETDGTSAATQWEYHIINYVKQYESAKPNQHPVGMTAQWPNGNNTDLFNSPADWISPNASALSPYDYKTNPPPANGSKVIIADTDHLWGLGGDRTWAWKSFLRGLNVIYMDTYLGDFGGGASDESLRMNMGYILDYAGKMGLLTMTPQLNLSSTTYCLANVGNEYLVYSPSGGTFTVNLTAAPGSFSVEWFNPSTGNTANGGSISGGAQKSFTPPFSGDAVLYLKNNSVVDTTPPTTPSNLTASVISSTQINLSWTSSTDNIGVAGYKVFRNGSQIGISAATSYQDKNLTPNTTYTYAVSAYDASGNTSSLSQQVSTRTLIAPDTTPPTTPSNLTASAISSTQINLSWVSSTDNIGVAGYKVFRNGSQIGISAATSYQDKNLTPNTTYTYAVSAYDAAGNTSSLSQQVSVRTSIVPDTTPPVISNIRVSSVTKNSARITWTTDEPSDSQVEYGKTQSYGSKTSLNATMVTSHSVTIYGLSSWTTYFFRVYSKDASANVSVSSGNRFTTRWW